MKSLNLPPDEVDKRLTAMGILTRCPTCSSQWEAWDRGEERIEFPPRDRLASSDPVQLECERGHRFPVDLLEAPGA